ncbi:hypothetical protein EJ110_NYTH13443 [Nymphaea thermarum]|nr:hypothetical protein EJ110_NYTH13443 [Nymphaea thermarum]
MLLIDSLNIKVPLQPIRTQEASVAKFSDYGLLLSGVAALPNSVIEVAKNITTKIIKKTRHFRDVSVVAVQDKGVEDRSN